MLFLIYKVYTHGKMYTYHYPPPSPRCERSCNTWFLRRRAWPNIEMLVLVLFGHLFGPWCDDFLVACRLHYHKVSVINNDIHMIHSPSLLTQAPLGLQARVIPTGTTRYNICIIYVLLCSYSEYRGTYV